MNSYRCKDCNRNFNYEKNLKRHSSKGCSKKILRICCSECGESFSKSNFLNSHIEKEHNFAQEKEEREFTTYEEFLKWKKGVEREMSCSYVKRQQWKVKNGSTKIHFLCHRSGFFISKSTGVRRIKSQGSNKIDAMCPSTMVVTQGDSVHIEYFKNHFGHSTDIGRCAPATRKKTMIAGKISTFDGIIDDIMDNATTSRPVIMHKDISQILQKMDPKCVRNIIENVKYPIVIKNNCDWPLLSWTLDAWSSRIGEKELRFRGRPGVITKEPCWERECPKESLTFKEFITRAPGTKDWLYFDYNYIDQWFPPESEICNQINWGSFGFPEAGAKESSLWIGSEGAHTPCHQDSYGKNIVLQVYGRKRWLLFPPDAVNMKTTRVPYEESSMYSQLNFYYPINLDAFQELSGCRMVILEPGDALVVPHKWWHYVEHVSPIGIAINTWMPCEADSESKVEESITRNIISQFCKDVPEECLLHLLNPNEDDTPEIDLNTNLFQLETTVIHCIEKRSKSNRNKRLKTDHDSESSYVGTNCQSNSDICVENLISECSDLIIVNTISTDELMDILKENLEKHAIDSNSEEVVIPDENGVRLSEDVVDMRNHFACRLLKAICQPNVIQQIKENLIKECNNVT